MHLVLRQPVGCGPLGTLSGHLLTFALWAVLLGTPKFELQGESLQSTSGQFLTIWVKDRFYTPELTPNQVNQGWVALTPSLVSLTAEQVKTGVLKVLGLEDQWSQRIRIHLSSKLIDQEPFVTLPTRFNNGWGFRVMLYPKIRKDRWIRNLVHVLLLDLINRAGTERMFDPPAWLIDGVWQEMLQTSLVDPSLSLEDVVAPGQFSDPGMRFRTWVYNEDATHMAKLTLKTLEPLSLESLLMPESYDFDDIRYRHSAHLLFHGLLTQVEGVSGMQQFLREMPHFLNWQTTFHRSYHASFPNMLRLEKWWALQTAALSQYNPVRRADMQRSLELLKASLTPQAKLAEREDALPVYTSVSLEGVIGQWEGAVRDEQLRQVHLRLMELKNQVVFECVPLVEDYAQLIQEFLEQLSRLGFQSTKKGALPLRERTLVNRTLGRLEQLELRRLQMLEQFRQLDAKSAAGSGS